MKSLTRVKRLIEKQLTSKEVFSLVEFCRKVAYEKQNQEHITKLKSLGKGAKVIVQGGSSYMVEQGLAGLVGTIVRYNPKTITVKFSETRSWYVPYHYLYPATKENIKRELKLKGDMESLVGTGFLKQLNKTVQEVEWE